MGGLYLSPDMPDLQHQGGNLSGGLDRVSTVSAPTALYRRYRPDSFADVIGQEHVTAPLMTALEKNRVNHAYLFSGPRGCGKTTSARILARCLNCAQGPTSHPCGECDSCIELARGGTGSLDVIEIDAASHGGVDDARDLRERATFAPIRDRYKIFIIDEAHMVTSAGFNALLKIVEEPPEHIKFIFATTEPDKVIGTIRSRTHHYPFRLVPPEPLMAYLAQLCERESVAVAPGVLSLVVRAGGGSVRDSLSVLDQLMAGAGSSGLDYDLAVDLLGYTHASLLDDVVEALAANDSATVFKSVDRVIQTGHDPRRFVEDLLERFRDLIIVHAMPESAHAILRGIPDELIARMQSQAAQLGAAELSRAADVTNAAFNEMTGATSPRLHLELLGARLLLPGADSSVRGMATRLDQLERRLNYSGAPAASTAPAPASAPVSAERGLPQPRSTADPAYADPGTSGGGLAAVRAQLARAKAEAGAEVAARQSPAPSTPETVPASESVSAPESASAWESVPTAELTQANSSLTSAETQLATPPLVQTPPSAEQIAIQPVAHEGRPSRTWDELPTPSDSTGFTATPESAEQPSSEPSPKHATATPTSAQPVEPHATATGAPSSAQPPSSPSPAGPAVASQTSGIEVIRRAWPEILGSLRGIRMASWAIVTQNVVPQTFDGRELRVGLPSDGLIGTFSNSGHLENLQRAIHEVLGLTVQILAAAGDAPKASSEPNPKVPTGSLAPQRETRLGASPTQQAQTTPKTEPQSTNTTAASLDDWGLPTQAPSPAAEPEATPAPADSVVDVTDATPGEAPDYWDEPTEPSDSWDEPGHDNYPPSDSYSDSPQDQQLVPPAAAAAQAAAAAPRVHTPPRVSPIAAWTTGWDIPATSTPTPTPPATTPATPEVPKRSALLAEQIAQQASPGGTQQSPQDWGVSLGHTARQSVAEPGWGSMSTAPDWAKPGTPISSTTPDAPAEPTSQGTNETAPTPHREPAQHSAEPSTLTQGHADAGSAAAGPRPVAKRDPESDSAQQSDSGQESISEQGYGTGTDSPLGASPNYPTPAQTPQPQTAPAQVAPAADPDQRGARLSMYQRMSNSSAAHTGRAPAPVAAAKTAPVEDVPSPDDVTIEESGVVGQTAVERILGGILIEERPLN